jgi:hypothetical protein
MNTAKGETLTDQIDWAQNKAGPLFLSVAATCFDMPYLDKHWRCQLAARLDKLLVGGLI